MLNESDQRSELLLAERMKKMMAMDTFADIHFLVGKEDGKEIVFAHKIVLAASSDVFEAMFPFDAANSNVGNANNPIVVDDIEVDVFKVMLNYIYSYDLSELNGDNAMALLYAANKYDINGLVKSCLTFPIEKLSNVFMAYAYALLFDLEEYAQQCLLYIDQNAQIFKSEEFLGIDQEMLCEILERDQLRIGGEIQIWEAALRWADAQCRQIGIECSGENRRAMLGPALLKIRFPLISKNDFSTKIVPSGVLTNEDAIAVYQYHRHPNLCDLPELYLLRFSTQSRIQGILTFEIEKLSEFAWEEFESERMSLNASYIGGLPWEILARIEKSSYSKCLGIYLKCCAPKESPNWACKCSASVRIVSQKKGGTESDTVKFKDLFFNGKSRSCVYHLVTFDELMAPVKGFYNKKEDKVTVTICIYDVAIII